MKWGILLLILINFNLTYATETAFDIELAKARCAQNNTDDSTLYMNEFGWGFTKETMHAKFQDIYASGKRLPDHAVYNNKEQSFYLFYEESSSAKKPFKITEEFILSITRHIEINLEKGFADYVFFPDMGHSHLYFPQEHWKKNYEPTSNFKTYDLLYQKMLADPMMNALYHTAEQLQMTGEDKKLLPDPYLQFRYWHRNPVGSNMASEATIIMKYNTEGSFNTVNSIEDYKDWSAGFSLSASKNGCFPYRGKDGKVYFFDIGLREPPYDPNVNLGEESGY